MDRYLKRSVATLCLSIAVSAAVSADDLPSGLADPTQPSLPAGSAAAPSDRGAVLQSTLVSPIRRVAVIDGRSYRPGERFGAGTIESIGRYEVVIREQGATRTLRMLPRRSNAPDENERTP